jgi:hypothetical protein
MISNCSKRINNNIFRGIARKIVVPNQSVFNTAFNKNATILFSQKRWKTTNKKLNTPSLSSALLKELEHENAPNEIDVEFEDVKKNILKSFTLTDEVGLGIVKLHRVYKDETIDVKFDCQDESDSDESEYPPEGEEEEEPAMSYGINFEVTISKG